MKFLFLLAMTSSAFALEIRPGHQRLGDCTIEVTQGFHSEEVHVRVDKGNQYGTVTINTNRGVITSINTCNNDLHHVTVPMRKQTNENERKLNMWANCGGANFAQDNTASISIKKSSGRITWFQVKVKIAKYALSKDVYLGAVKETTEDFSCN